jgi:hypothetical protein
MRRSAHLLVLAVFLAGCSYSNGERQGAFPTAERQADGTVVYREPRRDGSTAVAIVGTPFFAVFKAVTCVATVVVAAPAAGLIALTDNPDRYEMRRSLDDGVGHNCGGPYYLRG